MPAKYLPTVRDQRASERYQKKQLTQSKFIRPSTKPAAAPAAAKKKSK